MRRRLLFAPIVLGLLLGCQPDGRVAAARCGSIDCDPGLYCAAPDTCMPGCTDDLHCSAGEVCQRGGGAVGACAPVVLDGGGDVDGGGGPDSGSPDGGVADAGTPTGPVCGDLLCAPTESPGSCPSDCAAPMLATCTRACESLAACDAEITPIEQTACLATCEAARDDQITAFAECVEGTCSECLYRLWECGDGRCEGFESFSPSTVECPADCGGEGAGFDCFFRCNDYVTAGCISESVELDCRRECFLTDEPARDAFLACAAPTAGSTECRDRTCLEDFGVACTDASCGACGDGTCDPHESYALCPSDCRSFCGDGFCTFDEECVCAADCGSCETATCGDGTCNGGETCASCAGDCGACEAACRNDYTIRKGPFRNTGAGLGQSCADADGGLRNCMDGTGLYFPSADQCICSVLCSSMGLSVGDDCSTNGTMHCLSVDTDYGDRAVICALDSWGLCSE